MDKSGLIFIVLLCILVGIVLGIMAFEPEFGSETAPTPPITR
ncbi:MULTISPECIES: exopeptide [Ensifer]|jgi:uncharacterized protein YneF (UPF0154 family)|uniref:Exopeptide n=1 Tax=Ensifer canadensis TaxID=555315 RepID=A0AAW4FTD5_9HYPH|nr:MULTISPECIES: exopeptide [Ensifer]MBM3094677.1 exopeptide [Ensifer canadensis]NOV20708.1 exopeptide [Ensifer canadensis]PSS61473.1 exopeptide [Ensifer sp. NM-2]UBI79589.1 exopeptide [Ensifer canadensis]